MKHKVNDLFLLAGSRRSERTKAKNISSIDNLNKTEKAQSKTANVFPDDIEGIVPINQMCRYSVGPQRIHIKEQIWDGYRRFQRGDIVRIVDEEDGNGYFAQITAFISDDYANHFALAIWLLPKPDVTSFSSASPFEPDKFQHGLAEESPVPIRACEFICKCPPFLPYKRGWMPCNQILAQQRKEIVQRIEEAGLK